MNLGGYGVYQALGGVNGNLPPGDGDLLQRSGIKHSYHDEKVRQSTGRSNVRFRRTEEKKPARTEGVLRAISVQNLPSDGRKRYRASCRPSSDAGSGPAIARPSSREGGKRGTGSGQARLREL